MSATLELQPRDLEILQGLFESRLMNLSHLSTLYFQDRTEAAKKRTQKLIASGYLKQRPRQLYQPAIYQLTNKSIRHLRKAGVVKTYRLPRNYDLSRRMQVSELTLRHELDVLDIKVAFFEAVSTNTHLKLIEASTWPLLSQFSIDNDAGKETINKPDGFFRLQEQLDDARFEHAFFIEMDRSTEPLGKLAKRAAEYRQFYREGGLAPWYGRPVGDASQYPFRVLYVFQNQERRNNTAEQLLRLSPPVLTQVWMTTRDELLQEPFGRIWITPKAYRDAIAETQFDNIDMPPAYVYRRRPERERLVEESIVKSSLL